MKQLTIRGFDAELESEIRRLASRQRLSLNQAVISLLRRGAGLDATDDEGSARVGSSLDHLAGTWSNEEARAMAEVETDFEHIDAEIWE